MSEIETHQPNEIMRMSPEINFVLYKDHLKTIEAKDLEIQEYWATTERFLRCWNGGNKPVLCDDCRKIGMELLSTPLTPIPKDKD